MDDIVTISNSHENEIQFDVSVEGTDVSEMRVRFIINGPKGANYSFNCRQSDQAGKWDVTIPPLPHLPKGKYDFDVEVITNGYYFDPYKGTVEVTPKPTVSTTSTKPAAPKVTVSQPSPKAEDKAKKESKQTKKPEEAKTTETVESDEDQSRKATEDLVNTFLKSRENKAPLNEKDKAVKDALKDFRQNRPPKREVPKKAPPKKKVAAVKKNEHVDEEVTPRKSNLSSVIEKLDQPKDEQARKIHDIINSVDKGQE